MTEAGYCVCVFHLATSLVVKVQLLFVFLVNVGIFHRNLSVESVPAQ